MGGCPERICPCFQYSAGSCFLPLPKGQCGIVPFAATLIVACSPMLLGICPHRTKLKMHCFLHHCSGMRCKAFLMSSEPRAKFGSIAPCKIRANERIFFNTSNFIRLKENVKRWAIDVCEFHQQAPCEFFVYLSAGAPYSQSPYHSWQESGGGRTCLMVHKSQHREHGCGSQLIPQLPTLLQGSLALQLGLQREQGQRQFYLFGKHSSTMEMKAT